MVFFLQIFNLELVLSNRTWKEARELVKQLYKLTSSGKFQKDFGLKDQIRHNSGRIKSTQNRLSVELIYYKACLNQSDAFRREKYLKTTYGRHYLKNRLREYFTG